MRKFDRETSGRTAMAEIRLYDETITEFMSEKLDRARKFARTHSVRNDGKCVRKDAGKSYRKEKHFHGWDAYTFGGYETVYAMRRAEKIRTDAIDAEIEEINAEIDRENAEMDAEIAAWIAQAERMNEATRKYAEINRWLQYA